MGKKKNKNKKKPRPKIQANTDDSINYNLYFKSCLDFLPDELLADIFTRLNACDLREIRYISKRLQYLLEDLGYIQPCDECGSLRIVDDSGDIVCLKF